jgi:hypothetical protein
MGIVEAAVALMEVEVALMEEVVDRTAVQAITIVVGRHVIRISEGVVPPTGGGMGAGAGPPGDGPGDGRGPSVAS